VTAKVPAAQTPFLLMLGMLLGMLPVATDLYLPALPSLSQDLGPAGASLTLFMLAFGCGQLFWGRTADRLGRRPVLLMGLGAYALTGLGAALAPALWVLVSCRAGQGLALAAVVVCARAAVRDRFPAEQGPRIMAAGFVGVGVVALFAPVLGAVAVAHWGWRAPLGLVSAYAALALLVCAAGFRETRQETRSTRLPALPLRELLRSRSFRGWTSLAGFSYAGTFCFLVCSPTIYIQGLGLPTTLYGWVPASCSLVYLAGVLHCRRALIGRGADVLARRAALYSLTGAVVQALGALLWPHSAWPLLAGQWIYVWGHGTHQPCGQAGAVHDFPSHAGQAVAWSGFLMMALAFVAGQAASEWLVGQGPMAGAPGSPAWPMVCMMLLAALALNLVARLGLPRQGTGPTAEFEVPIS
jgi:MFS transporter, DHA1 family, multidrug resistance protein